MTKPVVLIVDDNAALRETMRENLEEDGYQILMAANAAEVLVNLGRSKVDTVLLDLGLPDADGLGLIEKIKHRTDAPVIVVSGKGTLIDKVVGLEMGADDYMGKPFEMKELSARIKANIRRYKGAGSKKKDKDDDGLARIRFGRWILDPSRMDIINDEGARGNLTVSEFRLLEALVRAPNRVLTREYLLDSTRSDDFDVFERAIDIQIARIRRKIGDDARNPQVIVTVRGAGYTFASATEIVE